MIQLKDLPLNQQEPFSTWLLEKYEVKNKLIKITKAKQIDYDLWLCLNYPCSS